MTREYDGLASRLVSRVSGLTRQTTNHCRSGGEPPVGIEPTTYALREALKPQLCSLTCATTSTVASGPLALAVVLADPPADFLRTGGGSHGPRMLSCRPGRRRGLVTSLMRSGCAGREPDRTNNR